MNFLAWAFAKHILCLFFTTKAFMCYVLNFFETKAFMCLFSPLNYIENVLIFFRRRLHMLIFFVEGFMSYVLNFFKKWAFMCLNGHVLIKKMSVEDRFWRKIKNFCKIYFSPKVLKWQKCNIRTSYVTLFFIKTS